MVESINYYIGVLIDLYFHPYLGKISTLASILSKWVGSTTN